MNKGNNPDNVGFDHYQGQLDPLCVDAERMCIGLMMCDHELVYAIKQHVDARDFYIANNQKLVQIIYELSMNSVHPDPVAVIQKLQNQEAGHELEELALELYDSVPISQNGSMSENASWYAKLVREAAERRRLMLLTRTKYDELLKPDPDRDLEVIVGDMIDQIFRIRRVTDVVDVHTELKHITQLLQDGDVFGIETGFPSLDRISCGYQAGEFYVIGGRPAMGKTALALKLAINLCKAGVNTMIVSLEMPLRQLLLRALSIESGVPYRHFRERDSIAPVAWPRIAMASARMNEWPLFVDDTSGIQVEQIIARIEAQYYRQNVQVVFIDHMHMIPSKGHGNNAAEAYSYISLMLKNLARRLGIPVVCLAQLNRNVENRSNKRPKLSDLRESGGIEQNADNVWFVYRPAYYENEQEYRDSIETIELIIAKNKSLETGKIDMEFRGAYMNFVDPKGA